MTSLDAYRIALVEGLTAKQAGAKFNLNYTSIANCKNRYGLPSLKNEWDAGYEKQLEKLTDIQLLTYYNLLLIPKNKRSAREFNVCKMLIEKRRLCTN